MSAVALVDIKELQIDNTLPINERVQSMVAQIKNPYKFKYNGVTININFVGNDSLEEKIVEIYKNT